MTDQPRSLTSDRLPLGLLESQWAAIESVAAQVAEEIEYKSVGLSGNFLERTRFAVIFFRGDCEYEEALHQSTLLAFLNPLAQTAWRSSSSTGANQSPPECGTLSQKDVANAVSSGLCTLSRHGVSHRSLLQLYLFPICLSYFWAISAMLAAHFIMAYFEQMYLGFGIQLPWMTSFFFWLGRLIRNITLPLLIILFGLPPLLWGLNLFGRKRRPPGASHLDLLFARQRTTIARWALHLSLLLEAGIDEKTAVSRAASGSKRWIRGLTERWQQHHAAPVANAAIRFFESQQYHLANCALELPRSAAKVSLLREVAAWYRDRSASILQWWIQFLIPLLGFFVIGSTVLFLMSMLFPIVGLFSGLTGF